MATGYVRQSAADIVSGEVVRAAPLNNEFNAIRDAFSTASGHNHDGTTGGGAYISTVSDSDNDTKVVADGTTNSVQVSTAGTERMRVGSNGRVGIGRTAGGATLDVQSSGSTIIRARGNSGAGEGAGFYVTAPGSDSTMAAFGDRASAFGGTPGQLTSIYTFSTPLTFDVGATERMRIDATGARAVSSFAVGDSSGNLSGAMLNESDTSKSVTFAADPGNVGASSFMRFNVDGAERMRIDGSGTFNFNGNILTNIASPSSSADVVTKGYVDSAVALGGSLTADVNLSGFKITNMGTPTASADATTKSYVDTADTNNRNLTYYSLQVI